MLQLAGLVVLAPVVPDWHWLEVPFHELAVRKVARTFVV